MIGIIIIIFFLIVVIALKKENFNIKTENQIDGSNINVQETYNWPCNGCTTNTSLKPKFKYNLSDNRCAIVAANDYSVSINKLNDINLYKSEPTNDFTSCSTAINTLYSSSKGNYIIIQNTKPFILNSLIIQDRANNIIDSTNFIAYTKEGYYVESLINKYNVQWPSITYLSIDLMSNTEVGRLLINHGNQINADNFVGSEIFVTNNYRSVSFYKKITDSSIDKIIYTQNNTKGMNGPNDNGIYSWPNCTNCTTYNSKLRKKSSYYAAELNNKCYIPIDYVDSNYLNSSVFNTLSSSDINKYFSTCFWPIRYLRISRAPGYGANYIDLCSFELYFKNTFIYDSMVSGICSPQFENYLWTNLQDRNDTTFAHTQNTADAYIELDYGKERESDKVRVYYRYPGYGRALGTLIQAFDSKHNVIFGYTVTTNTYYEYIFAKQMYTDQPLITYK